MDNLIPVSAQPSLPGRPAARAHNGKLAALWRIYGGEPFQLLRTQDGRSLSCERYWRAQEFMPTAAPEAQGNWTDFLYFSGITFQLALSSHLLDVGFPDAWCARYIGLHVDRSLAYANATGFGYVCEETDRLAQVLSPYWKWNQMHRARSRHPSDGGFKRDDVRELLNALLQHVGQVTGHGRSRRRAMPS
ncbi:hypothetical protein [Novosphingobium sp. KN65.2]|uniref:hypothetical protein n=1 Tax=Novosphingobium sp. KN65.2 TaxID=1478134 RepID=UPI0005DC2CB0|nr:hypothetical protein [Novosphingobium sp. KN65.2]CDO37999.1 hypothetical protein SPHV1_480027 [Novosphingobium sp. KN65.2]